MSHVEKATIDRTTIQKDVYEIRPNPGCRRIQIAPDLLQRDVYAVKLLAHPKDDVNETLLDRELTSGGRYKVRLGDTTILRKGICLDSNLLATAAIIPFKSSNTIYSDFCITAIFDDVPANVWDNMLAYFELQVEYVNNETETSKMNVEIPWNNGYFIRLISGMAGLDKCIARPVKHSQQCIKVA